MLATVVIPCHGREFQLERAIGSILSQEGSDRIEIIVVDDASLVPLAPTNLRPHDTVIRNDRKRGAAVSRNLGITRAIGKFVYLLDSDDYFLDRNFEADACRLADDALYYCSIQSGRYRSEFPGEVHATDFFGGVLRAHPYLCQTSTLVFPKSLGLRFDESLPRHQDWDFVYFQALLKGIPVRKAAGVTFFDRSDKASISRSRNADSLVWLRKLSEQAVVSPRDWKKLRFALLAGNPETLPWGRFLVDSVTHLLGGDASPAAICKSMIKRFR